VVEPVETARDERRQMNVVVGITGGIAAYKAVGVVRALVLAGHDVHVVPTEGALRFVGRPTLEAISRNPVHSDLYEGVAEVRHVAVGQAADLIVIAPATANSIAKLANGLADDLLSKVDSKYQLVIFASKRARQINDYYADLHEGSLFDNVGPLVDSSIDDKPLSVALHEINEDKLRLRPIGE
jgi:DNA-directed RNA polymerase omega subunit